MDAKDVLLLVDVLDDFAHEHGAELLASLSERQPALVQLLGRARGFGAPVVFANDNKGIWDGDATRLIRAALAGPGGALLRQVAPRADERFVVKPRYSAFDHTPLDLILDELRCERLVIAGMTTEGCVAQSAIAARELGLKVSVAAHACATTDNESEAIALRYLVDVVGVHLETPTSARGGSAGPGADHRLGRAGARATTSRAPASNGDADRGERQPNGMTCGHTRAVGHEAG